MKTTDKITSAILIRIPSNKDHLNDLNKQPQEFFCQETSKILTQ